MRRHGPIPTPVTARLLLDEGDGAFRPALSDQAYEEGDQTASAAWALALASTAAGLTRGCRCGCRCEHRHSCGVLRINRWAVVGVGDGPLGIATTLIRRVSATTAGAVGVGAVLLAAHFGTVAFSCFPSSLVDDDKDEDEEDEVGTSMKPRIRVIELKLVVTEFLLNEIFMCELD